MNHDHQPSDAPAEIEIKLFVPPASVERVWAQPLVIEHAIGPRRVERLDNRYFDTPDRDLAAQRMALRLRSDGSGWVQTVKTGGARDGALSRRGEWEEPVDGPTLDWTKLAATPLADFVARPASRKRLRTMFTTDFERQSQRLRLADGSEVEFAFDRGTIAAEVEGRGSKTAEICEIEIELKQRGRDDPSAALLRFAARLARSLPLIPLAASKAARGYALRDGRAVEATKVTLPRPTTDIGPARYLARVLAACNDALLANAHALLDRRTDEDDLVEPVHQARVAIRRLRSALRLFRPVVDGRRLRAIDTELRELGRRFGAVRDHDVAITITLSRLDRHVGRDAAGRDALAAMRPDLDARRAAKRRALLEALANGTFGKTTLEIERAAMRLARDTREKARDPRNTPMLAACAAKWLPRQHARIVALARRLATLDEEGRHRLRIEVKRLRYAVDLLEALYDEDAVAAFRAALSALQERLGQLNDAAVARTVLRSASSGAAVELVLARDGAWFVDRLKQQLPKVAADVMKLELAVHPWTVTRATPPPHDVDESAPASSTINRLPRLMASSST